MSLEDLELLNLAEEPLPVDAEDLPQEWGVRYPTPQPGYYTFVLPKMDEAALYEEFTFGAKGNRLKVNFQDRYQLYIEDLAHPLNRVTLSNAEEPFFDKDRNKKFGSQLAFLLKALDHSGPLVFSKDYVTALAGYSGGKFRAKLIWTAFSNPKTLYARADGGPKVNGNGQRWSTDPREAKDPKYTRKAIPKVNGLYSAEFEGTAGEILRAFPELKAFGPAV